MTDLEFPRQYPDLEFPLTSLLRDFPLQFQEQTVPPFDWPLGTRRILSVGVKTRMRGDLKLEREFRSRRVQHAWELPWNALSTADKNTLVDFFVAQRGRYGRFQITDPFDSLVYTVRLDLDAMQCRNPGGYWQANLRFVEVDQFHALKSVAMVFPALTGGLVCQYPGGHERIYSTAIGAHEDFSELYFEQFGDAFGIRRWNVGGDAMLDADAVLLLDFWESAYGSVRAFTFTDPEGVWTGSAHFVENSVIHILICPGVNAIRASVEELK